MPAQVLLVWGQDPFLLREEALVFLAGTSPVEADAADWRGSELSDLATVSLFGGERGLLVNNCADLPDHALGEIEAFCSSPPPDARLVLVARVGDRGKPPASLARIVEKAGEVRNVGLQRKDLAGWLMARAKRAGVQLATPAAATLIETVGEDPAVLDQALEQLATAFPEQKVSKEIVATQFRGLGDQRVWDLCDKAFAKDLPASVRSLESLLDLREDPLMILGVVAARVRDLIRVKAASDRLPLPELAKTAGLRFEWQARRYRDQAGRFSAADLVRIHQRIVEADRVLKSGGSGDVVLAQLVASVAAE